MSTSKIWRAETGDGPLVATAVHDGHAVREELEPFFALDSAARLREEDPFTGEWTAVAPTRVVGTRSRFEVDLNRPRDGAVYRTPEDAWGLQVWGDQVPPGMFDRSLAEYDLFYSAMKTLLADVTRSHGHVVVYDLHSYNHRRNGPDAAPAPADGNPQVNIGTGSVDRERWGPVVEVFIEALRAYDFPGGRLDVRENVKFQGGRWPRWIHEQFPDNSLAIAIEFKKVFMDEWTGMPDRAYVDAIAEALRSTVEVTLETARKR